MSDLSKEREDIIFNATKLYKLKNLVRYNNMSKIRDETVLEHTAMVALIVLDLAERYDFDVDKAVKLALVHDLPEIELSDIPYNVKVRFPKVNDSLKDAELDVCSDFPLNISSLLTDLTGESTAETKIVKFADIISCEIYSASEVELGNSGKIKEVLNESRERILKFQQELEEFRR